MSDLLFPYAATGAEPILAATRQWLERAVIGLNLCPFAKSVFVKKQVRYALTAAATADELLAELEQELALLAATEAEALIRNNGYDGIFQIAGLHPQYEFAGSDPDDVANYTNRAPYPMLHLLRESSIDRAVAAFPDAADIFERNIETMERLGHEGWRKLWLA